MAILAACIPLDLWQSCKEREQRWFLQGHDLSTVANITVQYVPPNRVVKLVTVSRKLMPMCVRPWSWTCCFTSLKKHRACLEKVPLLLIAKTICLAPKSLARAAARGSSTFFCTTASNARRHRLRSVRRAPRYDAAASVRTVTSI